MSKKLKNKVQAIFEEPIKKEVTKVVPDKASSALTHGNTSLFANLAFLFIDIRDSSLLETVYGKDQTPRIYKAFHEIAVKSIQQYHGKVRSFDGDRVMVVFDTKRKASAAVACAWLILNRIQSMLNPKLKQPIRIGAGIDLGELTIMKVGRGNDSNNQDLVWTGTTCNLASKLSDLGDNKVLITQAVMDKLRPGAKVDTKGGGLWKVSSVKVPGFEGVTVYEG